MRNKAYTSLVYVLLSAFVAVPFALMACGESTETIVEENYVSEGLETVDKASKLPKCTSDNEGEMVWVKKENEIRVCVEGEWLSSLGKESNKNGSDTIYIAGDTIYLGADTVYVAGDTIYVKSDTIYVAGDTIYVESDTVYVAGDTIYVHDKGDTVYLASAGCETEPLPDGRGLKVLCGGDSVGIVLHGQKGEAGEGCSIATLPSQIKITCGASAVLLNLDSTGAVSGGETVTLDSEKIAISLDGVTGVVQKGPFLLDSKVFFYELESGRTLAQTDNVYNGKVLNDKGEFEMSAQKLVSQYVKLLATGYYRKEVSGYTSDAPITLSGIADMNLRNMVNINILTHLEYERVIYLVTQEKMKFNEAKRQAQAEILDIFHIDATDFSLSEDLDIAGPHNGDGALLAISILLQGNRNSAGLTELLTEISSAIEKTGKWDAAATKIAIADWAAALDSSGGLSRARTNIESWGLSARAAKFEPFLRNYWYQELGLGVCGSLAEGLTTGNIPVAKNGEVRYVTNQMSSHYTQSPTDATNTKTRYICVADNNGGTWKIASNIEKDTATWGHNFTEGDVKNGNLNTTFVYVYDGYNWRRGTELDSLLYKNGGLACAQKKNTESGNIAVLKDTSSVKANDVYYVCSKNSASLSDTAYRWSRAPAIYNDTYEARNNCNAQTDGTLMNGRINDKYVYVCDFEDSDKDSSSGWERASVLESQIGGCRKHMQYFVETVNDTAYGCINNKWIDVTKWDWKYPLDLRMNHNLNYGSITDGRDQKTYRTIKIGNQVWMAENLNFADSALVPSIKGKNWCQDNKSARCEIGGRYYTWAAAIDSLKIFNETGNKCGFGIDSCGLPQRVRGVCPENWHLPSIAEWDTLISAVGNDMTTAGRVLKSRSGWNKSYGEGGNGTDDFGFSAIPMSYRNNDSPTVGSTAYFWSADNKSPAKDDGPRYTYAIVIGSSDKVTKAIMTKYVGIPVRCVKD